MPSPPSKLPDSLTLYKLRIENGLTFEEIGKMYNCNKTTAFQRMKKILAYLPDKQQVEVLEKHKPSILKGLFWQCVGTLSNEEKHEKASLNNAAFTLKQVHDIMRLEEGKSTINIGMHTQLVLKCDDDDKRSVGATMGATKE